VCTASDLHPVVLPRLIGTPPRGKVALPAAAEAVGVGNVGDEPGLGREVNDFIFLVSREG